MKEVEVIYRDNSIIWMLFSTFTAIIGVNIHGLNIWTLVDFLFAPFVFIYWLVTHQVTLQIIKDSFKWFLE